MLIVGHLSIEWVDAKAATGQCEKLSFEKRNSLLRNVTVGYPYLHWSFSLLPSFQQTAEEVIPRANPSVAKMARETLLYGKHSRICPARKNETAMKLCPVHYMIQNDENRIPENIVHVRCNCKFCSLNSLSVRTGKCVKEYVYTPVWRRIDGDCEYKKFIEHVTVACVCKMKGIKTIQA